MNSQPAATIVIDIRTQVVSRKMGSLGFAVIYVRRRSLDIDSVCQSIIIKHHVSFAAIA